MRVELPEALYECDCREYERGYGQRPMGECFFDNEEEAKKFCEEYFSGDPDCYYRADYQKIS